jgi:hypothetical protein
MLLRRKYETIILVLYWRIVEVVVQWIWPRTRTALCSLDERLSKAMGFQNKYHQEKSHTWTNIISPDQESPILLCNTVLLLVSMLSQMNPVHILISSYYMIYLILASRIHLGHLSDTFFSGFPIKMSYEFVICPMHPMCPTTLSLFDYTILIIFGELTNL